MKSSSPLTRFALLMGVTAPIVPAMAQPMARPDAGTAKAERLVDAAADIGGSAALAVTIGDASRDQFVGLLTGARFKTSKDRTEAAALMGRMYDGMKVLVPEVLADMDKGSDALSEAALAKLEKGARSFAATVSRLAALGVGLQIEPPKVTGQLANAYQAITAAGDLRAAAYPTANTVDRWSTVRAVTISVLDEARIAPADRDGLGGFIQPQITEVVRDAGRVKAELLNIARVGGANAKPASVRALGQADSDLRGDRRSVVDSIGKLAGTTIAQNGL